eukprot:TRINITY_DN4762_c0_g1_i1.p1 TRINITY_DN4762_c0_g1~~TRINITY_DN4762_c0_g1_i1.p1  ORF type:complete len:216 (-),score=25.70 TRINITY_DN4762_c0_g1_i1:646-1242(-)
MAIALAMTSAMGALSISVASVAMAPRSSRCSLRSSFTASTSLSSSYSSSFSGMALGPRSHTALRLPRPCLVVKGLAAAPPTKKPDSAVKRARQAEKRRIYNKSRRSEMATRMKKVFVALEGLKKSAEPTQEALLPIEKLISEAFKIIDKSVKVGTIHRNKGANRKSRLCRAKKAVEIQLGWYTAPPPQPVANPIVIST